MNGATSVTQTSNRLASLDAFRGFTIASMVLVNNPGDWANLYYQLGHAAWHGWTFTDWVFPFFLFIGGVSMTLSLGRRAEAGDNKIKLLTQLYKRAAIIFIIGLVLNFIPMFDLNTVRIPGVLQRIALCTALAAPIVVYFNWRQQCGWIIALFAIYSIAMLYIPVPDVAGIVAAGVLEPGRDFGAYVDRFFLDGHLWAKVKTWDPEGLWSTLPAIGSMLFGVLLGRFLSTNFSKPEKTVWMLIAGLACLWLGAILNSIFMPINKSLWTPSYAIAMNGWGLIVFGTFYWLMDATSSAHIREQAGRWFKPFTIYGMNALFIFVLSGLIAKGLATIKFTNSTGVLVSLKDMIYAPIKSLTFAPVNTFAPANTSLIYAVLFNLFMLLIAYFMWKKQWFVKI